MGAFGRILRTVGLACVLPIVAACSSVYQNHGYVPSEDELSLLQVGRDNRDTVADFIGRPSSAGILAEGGWYYVGSRWRDYAWRPPEEIQREVVAISFDQRGTVTNIERFGLERGKVIALSRRVTEDNVKGVGLIRQLLGNIGNIDPATFGASDAPL